MSDQGTMISPEELGRIFEEARRQERQVIDPNFNINKVISKAMLSYPFYSNIMIELKKVETDKIPTAAVTFDGKITLCYNKDFFSRLTLGEQIFILVHELMHVMLLHDQRGKGKDSEWFNIAADISINQLIKGKSDRGENPIKPDFVLDTSFFDNVPSLKDEYIQREREAEYYYGLIEKSSEYIDKEIMTESLYDKLTIPEKCDEHGSMTKEDIERAIDLLREQSTPITKDMVNKSVLVVARDKDMEVQKAVISPITPNMLSQSASKHMEKNIVEEMIESAKTKGSVPDELREEFGRIYKKNIVDWRKTLRNFLDARGRLAYRRTHLRESRRFEGVMGKRKMVGIRALLALDTSGSVSDEEYETFLAELRGIQKITQTNIDVVEVDTEIKDAIPLSRFYKKPKRTGYGGTEFDPAFEFASKGRYDLLIYFTDGYAEAPDKKDVHQKVIWCITEGGRVPTDKYGISIEIGKGRVR